MIEVSAADRRARIVRLTEAGSAERALLDRRTDALARSLLEPLDDTQRTRLLEAMVVVERTLTAGLIDVVVESGRTTEP